MGGGVLRTLFNSPANAVKLRIIGTRCNSSNNASIGNAGQDKMVAINRAVKLYLERASHHQKFMKEQIHDFEVGKRHLANMMGLDPENITQAEIDKAIRYLLPSGLFEKKARPMLKHPSVILPKFAVAQFDFEGRPYNSFYYTIKQNLSENLHEITTKTSEVKAHEDQQIADGVKFDQSIQLSLAGSEWLSHEDMEKKIDQKLYKPEYNILIMALDNLRSLPYSFMERDFILKYRTFLDNFDSKVKKDKTEILFDEEGRSYIKERGKRKRATAFAKVFHNGTGKITINGNDLLDQFPDLVDRGQILFPIHLVDMLFKVDVEAEISGGGMHGQSGAVRLAIAKAISRMVSDEQATKLRLAGLLTTDPRVNERMKPGQPGARRKPTWKKR